MKVNLPNQITIGRLILAVIFFTVLGQYRQIEPSPWLLDVSLAIFIVAALTDILDGYIARKQNQVTSLGRVLDPFVDKVLVCGVFVYFSSYTFVDESGANVTGVAPWMTVLILGREFLVTALRGANEAAGKAFGAMFFGKVKMVVQSVTAGVVLLVVAHTDGVLGSRSMVFVKTFLVWLTVFVTTASLIQYLVKSKHILAEASRP